MEYLYENRTALIKGEKKMIHEESVKRENNTLIIKYYHKENDMEEKIVLVGENDGSYKMKHAINKEEKPRQEMTEKDFLAMLKDEKLKFAQEHLKEIKKASKSTIDSYSIGGSMKTTSKKAKTPKAKTPKAKTPKKSKK